MNEKQYSEAATYNLPDDALIRSKCVVEETTVIRDNIAHH
jgi:hypothetical protein